MAENIDLFRAPDLTAEQVAEIAVRIPKDLPDELLDPSQWPKSS
jgi:hypothetical protein